MNTKDTRLQQCAIITPSFAPDFERCALLSRSIQRFVAGPQVTHYIIVDQRDMDFFKRLEGPRTKLITVESVIPWWIVRVPRVRRFWLSFRTLPVRNWLLQQIVKLSIARHVSEDILVFVDSDVSFVRPLPIERLVRPDTTSRLFRVPGGARIESHFKWHRSAAKLLGLPPMDYAGARYIGNAVTWRRENVFKLYDRLESVSGKDWIKTLCNQWHLSEYILYGTFIDHVLKDSSGHFDDTDNYCLEYWDPKPMSDPELEAFFQRLGPQHVAVMISAKAKIPAARYARFVEATFATPAE